MFVTLLFLFFQSMPALKWGLFMTVRPAYRSSLAHTAALHRAGAVDDMGLFRAGHTSGDSAVVAKYFNNDLGKFLWKLRMIFTGHKLKDAEQGRRSDIQALLDKMQAFDDYLKQNPHDSPTAVKAYAGDLFGCSFDDSESIRFSDASPKDPRTVTLCFKNGHIIFTVNPRASVSATTTTKRSTIVALPPGLSAAFDLVAVAGSGVAFDPVAAYGALSAALCSTPPRVAPPTSRPSTRGQVSPVGFRELHPDSVRVPPTPHASARGGSPDSARRVPTSTRQASTRGEPLESARTPKTSKPFDAPSPLRRADNERDHVEQKAAFIAQFAQLEQYLNANRGALFAKRNEADEFVDGEAFHISETLITMALSHPQTPQRKGEVEVTYFPEEKRCRVTVWPSVDRAVMGDGTAKRVVTNAFDFNVHLTGNSDTFEATNFVYALPDSPIFTDGSTKANVETEFTGWGHRLMALEGGKFVEVRTDTFKGEPSLYFIANPESDPPYEGYTSEQLIALGKHIIAMAITRQLCFYDIKPKNILYKIEGEGDDACAVFTPIDFYARRFTYEFLSKTNARRYRALTKAPTHDDMRAFISSSLIATLYALTNWNYEQTREVLNGLCADLSADGENYGLITAFKAEVAYFQTPAGAADYSPYDAADATEEDREKRPEELDVTVVAKTADPAKSVEPPFSSGSATLLSAY